MKRHPRFLAAGFAFALAACQTVSQNFPPIAHATPFRGQLLYSGPQRRFVGEFAAEVSPDAFQLDVTKGPGLPLISVRKSLPRQLARFEGGGHAWQGGLKSAPKPLRSWLALHNAFAARIPGAGTPPAVEAPFTASQRNGDLAVDFPQTNEHFVFHFAR
jgi:hypothetical protein